MAEDYDAYINAEFVDMVTNETWDFPTPYWEVDDNEDIFPMGIAQNFFIIFSLMGESFMGLRLNQFLIY